MKKIIFTTIMVLMISMSGYAQYFQSLYGSSNVDNLADAINTTINGDGYFMVGFNHSLSGFTYVSATFTDVNGVTGYGGYFNKSYILKHQGHIGVNAGNQVGFELPQGGFGIITDYYGTADGVTYIKLDASGNVLTTVNLANSVIKDFEIKGAVVASNGNEVMFCGNVNDGSQSFFLGSLNVMTSTLNWININKGVYNNINYDVRINNIYENQYNPGLYHMLGSAKPTNDPNKKDSDALLLNYFSGSASFLPFTFDYGQIVTPTVTNSEDEFVALDQDGYHTGSGLFITGNTTCMGTQRTFVSFFDYYGFPTPVTWISEYNYNSPPSLSKEVATDIAVRINTNNEPDVYSLVMVNDANIGETDWVVYKFNFATALPVGQYTYGDVLNDEPKKMTMNDGTNHDGLNIFGTTFLDLSTNSIGIGLNDEKMVKAYFNGASGCNEELLPDYTVYYYYTPLFGGFDVVLSSIPTTVSMSTYAGGLTYLNLCSASSIPSGSNAFSVPAEDPHKTSSLLVSPNPMLPGITTATVNLQTNVEEEVQVIVYDMLGKKYYTGSFAIKVGNNDLRFELPTAAMAKGMYTVKVTGTTINKTVRLMVQ